MSQTLLFCAVFASQLVLVTLFLARRSTLNLRYVLQHCPPATHPRLYPRPRATYERVLRNFTRFNIALGTAGLGIILAMLAATLRGEWNGELLLPWSASGEWDAAIIIPFFLLQVVPFVYLDVATQSHYNALAQLTPPRQRVTELRRRRLLDFISPAMLVTTAVVQGAFVAFLLDYRRHEFTWFTAGGNVLGVAFVDLGLLALLCWAMYGRRQDHYEADRDRLERTRRLVQPAWLVTIAMPVLVVVQLTLKVGAPALADFVVVSVFVQAVAVVSRWPLLKIRPERIDFDVYRQDAGARS
jgi:hypothetical protein